MTKKILVLFTCYNRKDKTINCIETLKKNKGIDFHFIVVDDNSSDGTSEWLKNQDETETIGGNGALFYSGGMRVAIEAAKKKDLSPYSFILLVNDDVVFFENAISKLIDSMEDEQAVVVGATKDHNGNLSYGGAVKTHRIKPEYRYVMSSEKSKIYCDTFCANCVLIPRRIFEKTPNIDCAYRHAMGDFDYGFSISRAGYKIIASRNYVGICDDNDIKGCWRDNSLSRRRRLQLKESPKGLPRKEWYHYLKKNHGITTAIIYSVAPYVRILLQK